MDSRNRAEQCPAQTRAGRCTGPAGHPGVHYNSATGTFWADPPEQWVTYRRTALAEMTDWFPGFDMTGVSVSVVDKTNGSPRPGDKIARNPKNHDDKWLVSAKYFADNFAPLDDRVR